MIKLLTKQLRKGSVEQKKALLCLLERENTNLKQTKVYTLHC